VTPQGGPNQATAERPHIVPFTDLGMNVRPSIDTDRHADEHNAIHQQVRMRRGDRRAAMAGFGIAWTLLGHLRVRTRISNCRASMSGSEQPDIKLAIFANQ
jgi:hypothetical protein